MSERWQAAAGEGFRLVEVLIVLGVVAVLASLAVPDLSQALHRSRRL